MKTLLAAISLLVSSLPALGDDFFINIGTNRFSLIFDDSSLTILQRTAIVADLQHEYNTLTNLPVILHDSAGKGYAEFTAYGGNPYENDIRLPFTYVIDGGSGTRTLTVETLLSDRYKVAFALQAANTNAFQSAFPFVESLRAGRLHNMSSNEVGQIFYYEKATPEMYAGSRDGLSAFLDQCTPIEPGLLSFIQSNQCLPEHGEVLLLLIPYIDHRDQDQHHAIPAVWKDDRWKLLLWD